ncbi:CGNR zinc finger domain-containing protein [Nocardia pseudobrasiliensis]|uniref:CGNR zinc finger domain-containing protein n=1 Tax=Nocardia pseudobrasiliensis TaxID=45979 RepID=UPI001FE7E408|nr:CGNR zinc finger domain-containing protein [Nocardia pseudobrasiliensis]
MNRKGPGSDSTSCANGCSTGLRRIGESVECSTRPDRICLCAAHDCHRFYADTTKNNSMRYCPDRGCANRERVRRHRRRNGWLSRAETEITTPAGRAIGKSTRGDHLDLGNPRTRRFPTQPRALQQPAAA